MLVGAVLLAKRLLCSRTTPAWLVSDMLSLRDVSLCESFLLPALDDDCRHIDVSFVAAWYLGQSVAKLRPRYPPSPGFDNTRMFVTASAPTTRRDESYPDTS
jgi:hypothetical protein